MGLIDSICRCVFCTNLFLVFSDGAFDECLLVLSDSPIKTVAGLPEVSKKLGRPLKFAAIKDSTNAALGHLWASRVGKEFVSVVDFDGATADVLQDMVDSTISGATDGTIDDCIAFPKYLGPEFKGQFRVAFVEPTQNPWALAFSVARPSPQGLVDAVNEKMEEMIQDGWFAKEWDRWVLALGSRVDHSTDFLLTLQMVRSWIPGLAEDVWRDACSEVCFEGVGLNQGVSGLID